MGHSCECRHLLTTQKIDKSANQMNIRLLFLPLSFFLLTCAQAQWGTPFNQRDDEYRLLGLKRAKSAYEAAKAELERNESLFNDELISENSLENARREFADAEVNYQQSLLAVIFEKQYVTVESAVKYQSDDGRKHVRLKLANASGGGQEYRKLINIDDALFRSLQPDVVNNVYVSLLNDENAIISQPYEAKIDRLLFGQPVTLDFALLQDLDAVVVNLVYGNGTQRSPKIYLQKDASENKVIVQSQQFSQEVELGKTAAFDLTLELFSGANTTYKLEVVNLPRQINSYFTDASGQARLSQFKFTESTNTRQAALQVLLPERPTDVVQMDQPITFYALVIPREQSLKLENVHEKTWTQPEIEALNVGFVRLELVPRGVGELLVKAPQLYFSIGDGESVTVDIDVKNEGSRQLDNIEITVDPPLRWQWKAEPRVISSLEIGEEQSLRLTFSPPENVSAGKYEFRVRSKAFSENRPLNGEDKSFTVEVQAQANIFGTAFIVLLILALVVGMVIFGIRLSRK